MKRETIFSPCRKYRYTLWREWDIDLLTGCSDDNENAHKFVQVIGLNPSTADETIDDNTVRRCIAYAKSWGYGALCMTNIFAYRDTDPEAMKAHPEPVGEWHVNDIWLMEVARHAGLVLCAWGNDGLHINRGERVVSMLNGAGVKLHCLQITGLKQPNHPLYLKKTLKPIPFL